MRTQDHLCRTADAQPVRIVFSERTLCVWTFRFDTSKNCIKFSTHCARWERQVHMTPCIDLYSEQIFVFFYNLDEGLCFVIMCSKDVDIDNLVSVFYLFLFSILISVFYLFLFSILIIFGHGYVSFSICSKYIFSSANY